MPSTTIDIDSGVTYEWYRGVNRVYNHFAGQVIHKGVNNLLKKFSGTTFGSNLIQRSFTAKFSGYNAIGGQTFFSICFGSNAILNAFNTPFFGYFGIQIHGLGSTFSGTNLLYNHFPYGKGFGLSFVGAVDTTGQFTGEFSGTNRIANFNMDGWVAYVGINELPDLNGEPTQYSPTLPFNVSVTFPTPDYISTDGEDGIIIDGSSGTGLLFHDGGTVVAPNEDVYVVVRKRDQYGLVSQNQRATHFILTPTGRLRLPIPTPRALNVILKNVGKIIIGATYATAKTDLDPADFWAVWVRRNDPADTSTPPSLWLPVLSINMLKEYYPLVSGSYYVTVGLYRSVDSSWSDFITTSVMIPYAPIPPVALPSGYAGSCDCSEVETDLGDFVAVDDWQDGIAFDDGAGSYILTHGGSIGDGSAEVDVGDLDLLAVTIDGYSPISTED